MKILISTLALIYRHCQSMRMTGEAKPSEAEAAKSELSVSVIPVDDSKKEEKAWALSSALTELVVDSNEGEQILGDGEGVKQKEVKEKDVSEGLISIDKQKKRCQMTKKRRCKYHVVKKVLS